MPSARETASIITAFLAAPETGSEGDLRTAATDYARFCREVNTRLRRCEEYIRQGLRAEAIYFAEINPDLLDMVNSLDLKNVDLWDDYCRQSSWEVAPRLLLDIAQQLNQVYAEFEPMAGIFNWLRVYALARAPLKTRLEAMRKLAALDQTTPWIDEDLMTFEKARINEIRAEVQKIHLTGDLELLKEMEREVSDSKWKVPVPPQLIAAIHTTEERIQVSRALAALKKLLAPLHDAFAAQSYDHLAALVEQWRQDEQVLSAHGGALPDDIKMQIEPIFEWYEGQRKQREKQGLFADACLQLEQALNTEESRNSHELSRLHRKAFLSGQDIALPIPDDVEQRCQSAIARKLHAEHIRRVWKGVAFGIAVLLVTLGVSILVYRGIQNTRLDQKCASIATMITNARLDEATKSLQQMKQQEPGMYADMRVQELVRTLEKAVAGEKERTKQFELFAEAARNSAAEEPQDREERKRVIAEARNALKQAEPLARTDAEKLQILEIAGQTDTKDRKWQGEVDALFTKQAQSLSAEFAAVDEKLIDKDLPTFEKTIDKLQEKLRRLKTESVRVSEDATACIVALEKQAVAWNDAVRREKETERKQGKERLDMANLLDQVANAEDPAKALKDFADGHPQFPKATALAKAVTQGGSDWTAVRAYANLRASWKNLFPEKTPDIEERLKSISDWCRTYPGSIFSEALLAYEQYLQRAQTAVGDETSLRAQLQPVLSAPIMQLLSAKTQDGKVYYCAKDAICQPLPGGAILIPVVKTFDVSKREGKRFDKDSIEEPRQSAQNRLAQAILQKLAVFEMSRWDTSRTRPC